MNESIVHRIVEGPEPLLRRRIVVWRRLEPGDVRTPGSLAVPESPFLEAKVLDIAIPLELHERMKSLAEARARATAIPRSPLLEYEPAGVLISGAGGIGVGVWLDYLRPAEVFQWIALGALIAGLALAVIAKVRRRSAEAKAASRWSAASERKEHEEVSRELAESWIRFSQNLKRDTGFHTEIRVAEGSSDPLRLASIDPRPMTQGSMDPEDFLPTEGGGVRYEALHAAGEIVSRLLPGAHELAEEAPAARQEPVALEAAAAEREA